MRNCNFQMDEVPIKTTISTCGPRIRFFASSCPTAAACHPQHPSVDAEIPPLHIPLTCDLNGATAAAEGGRPVSE